MASHPSPTLRQWLDSEGGAVPFRRFMEAALYDAGFGYYTRQIRTVGARGDFSTSATLGDRLARAIADWIEDTAEKEGGSFRHLIEIGPGSGTLHRALRLALGWRGRWHWRSHLVECSAGLRSGQKRVLGWMEHKISWHRNPVEALAAAGGRALIFSNELVDAFPVTLLQSQAGAWQEVWLELLPDGRLVETLRPAVQTVTALQAADFPDGQRVEVHDSYQEWLRAWRPHWKAGIMLTIDYGDTAGALYHRRPTGTLRGYHQHQRLQGLAVYRSPGECDLTADVNFTDLMQHGEALGMNTLRWETQAAFLARHSTAGTGADVRIADPDDAGGAFHCLQQRPAPDVPSGP